MELISLQGLGKVFSHLAKTNPILVQDFRDNVHQVSAILKAPPAHQRDPAPTAKFLSELFKPREGCPFVGISSSLLDGSTRYFSNFNPIKLNSIYLDNPKLFLDNENLLKRVISITVDHKNDKHSYFHFHLGDDQACCLEVTELNNQTDPYQAATVCLNKGTEVKVDIEHGPAVSLADSNLSRLLIMKDSLLLQRELAQAN